MRVDLEPGRGIAPDPSWVVGKHALMNVRARLQEGRTVVEPRSWRIPYQWQPAHYQDNDDEPFLMLLNSSGGFVEGDVAELHASLDPGARMLLTTSNSTKFYKCLDGEVSTDWIGVDVGPDALLEFYPDEAIPFARSRTRRVTRINLAQSSRLFATDMLSAGRVHFREGEVFAFDSIDSTFEINIDGRPAAIDRLILSSKDEVAALRRLWDGAQHMATVFVHAPDLPKALEDEVHAVFEEEFPAVQGGVSRLDDLIVARILSEETWEAHEAVYRVWSKVRPVLAGKAARPIRKQ